MKAAKDIKFEAALEELEKIVGEMENGEMALEKLVERYEEGMKLVKVCEDKLTEAEQKIEVLTRPAPSLESVKIKTEKKGGAAQSAPTVPADSGDVSLF